MVDKRKTRRVSWCLHTLFFASGLAALVYQVMWARSFGLIFGSTSRAASAVLCSFFLGMAAGNWLASRATRSARSALRLYAIAEVAIALGALAVLGWLALYQSQYPTLYAADWFSGVPMTIGHLLLAIGAMGPACIAMGATLPLMARVVAGEADRPGSRVAGIYAANTAGATLGVLASGFVLPVWLGVHTSVMAAVLLNLGVGAAAWLMVRRVYPKPESKSARGATPASAPQRDTPEPPKDQTRTDPALAWIAGASGFGTLALEVLYTRLLVNAMDNSVYSFAIMLAVFLVALALASVFVSLVVERMRSPWRLVAWTSALACLAILLSPRAFGVAVQVSVPVGVGGTWANVVREMIVAAMTLGPAALAAGVALPTVWKLATCSAEETSRQVGRLTAVNTLAAVAGSVCAGFVFVPILGLSPSFVIVALLYGAMAVLAWMRAEATGRRWIGVGLLVLGVAALWASHTWQVRPLTLKAGEKILKYVQGENATVAVTQLQTGVRHLRINNRYHLGNDSEQSVMLQRTQGRLALSLVEEPQSAAFIGVATGIGVSAAAEFPSLERVLALEIVPGVLKVTDAFAAANRRVLEDPRVELMVADGRNHLYGSRERYDAISGDLFVPWHAGTGYLYTREHFQTVAQRLTGRGVFAQWIMADQLSLAELRVIAASFVDAFPGAQLYIIRDSSLVALLGGPGIRGRGVAEPLPPNVMRLCAAPALERWTASAARNTDDQPLIEFAAAASHLGRGKNAGRASMSALARACAERKRKN